MFAEYLTVDVLTSVAGYLGLLLSLGALGMAAASTTNTFQGTDFFRTDVIANAASNVAITIPHGLGAIKAAAGTGIGGLAPLDVGLLPIAAAARPSSWIVTQVTTTNVVLGRVTTSQSQSAAGQVRVTVRRPHSIGR